jgi:hypothetical protein
LKDDRSAAGVESPVAEGMRQEGHQ